MGICLRIGGLAVGSSGGSSWTPHFYTLRSGAIWYKREINNEGGYFALHYSEDSGVTWDTLFTLDLTEDSVIIDLAHIYRHRIVGTEYRVDQTLTPTGYAGAETTDGGLTGDWENLFST